MFSSDPEVKESTVLSCEYSSQLCSHTIKMMGKIVEHFIRGLQQDCERLRHEKDNSAFDYGARKKLETKLYQLISELIDTERKYVADLEEVRNN